MLEVKNLSYKTKDKIILDDISFKLDDKINVLLGLNGAGKSTLFKCIMQQLAYLGLIEFKSVNLKDLSIKERASKIAFIPQNTSIYFDFSVKEIISFFAFAKGKYFHKNTKTDELVVEQIASMLNITHLLNKPFNAISGGEQKISLIASALAKDCEILIFDEPMAFLDLSKEYLLLEIFKKLDKCIFFSTHNPLNAIDFNTIILHDKKILKSGKNILNNELLEEIYKIPLSCNKNKINFGI